MATRAFKSKIGKGLRIFCPGGDVKFQGEIYESDNPRELKVLEASRNTFEVVKDEDGDWVEKETGEAVEDKGGKKSAEGAVDLDSMNRKELEAYAVEQGLAAEEAKAAQNMAVLKELILKVMAAAAEGADACATRAEHEAILKERGIDVPENASDTEVAQLVEDTADVQ